jgi:NhaA family Na+:H+ antiporter
VTVVFGARRTTEQTRILAILRKETVGGALLVGAALIALIWANSPAAETYFTLRNLRVGIPALHLDLTLGAWASDGLLAIFFFLVGLELKRELLAGELRNPKTAIVPVVAALGGVVVPAIIYVVVNAGDGFSLRGWAVPTATDIAFAVAVLALIGSHLPPALRIFLLTLAVVDDLIAIVIIAVFYTSEIHFIPLAAASIPIAVYALLLHRFRTFFVTRMWAAWVILLPIGVVAWALVHASGIHATIAGVVLGFMVPVLPSRRQISSTESTVVAEHFEHRFRPLSAGFAVPVFAFFSAGVTIGGVSGFVDAVTSPVGLGIIAALVLGKPLGIVGATWLSTTLTHARLDSTVKWVDLLGVGVLGGIGFTVSLLVAELSFAGDARTDDTAKVAILSASLLAALLAAVILGARNRTYKALEREQVTR